eukprot:m.123818 g.123818  ORF g.123818 m.123818 type:complete len:263 (-) comp15578_c0_seq2:189-977(-)
MNGLAGVCWLMFPSRRVSLKVKLIWISLTTDIPSPIKSIFNITQDTHLNSTTCPFIRPLMTALPLPQPLAWLFTGFLPLLLFFCLYPLIDALVAYMLCLTGQKSNYTNWQLVARCYCNLPHSDELLLQNFSQQCLVRALAWARFAVVNSNDFVKDKHIASEQKILEELAAVRSDLAAMTCHAAMEALLQELTQLTGQDILVWEDDVTRDYLEQVPPEGFGVDRSQFEREWFLTRRRLPEDNRSDRDLIPEPDLPEKGPRTGD